MEALIKNMNIEMEFVKAKIKMKGTKAASYSAWLYFVADKRTKYILDFKFDIYHCKIDLYTTASWFDKGNNGNGHLKLRQELLKKLNLENNLKRPEKGKGKKINKRYDLDKKWEKKVLNEFLNDRTKCTTLKNSVVLVTGRNPSGEETNSKNSSLVVEYSDDKWVPFSVFFQNLYVGDLCKEVMDELEWFKNHGSKNKLSNFREFVESNAEIKKAFDIFLKGKANSKGEKSFEFEEVKRKLKKNKKEFDEFLLDFEFRKRRNKLREVIINDNNFKKIMNTFKYTWREEWEIAHIFGVSEIKAKVLKFHNNKEFEKVYKYLDFINNKANFLPLENCIHKLYDNKKITYDSEGRLKESEVKKNDFQQIYERARKYNLHKLSDEWLDKERKNFILLHNNHNKGL